MNIRIKKDIDRKRVSDAARVRLITAGARVRDFLSSKSKPMTRIDWDCSVPVTIEEWKEIGWTPDDVIALASAYFKIHAAQDAVAKCMAADAVGLKLVIEKPKPIKTYNGAMPVVQKTTKETLREAIASGVLTREEIAEMLDGEE